jgi:thymidylate synthase (FAD)
MSNQINVLDEGYVRLVDTLGNDLSVVNAARVSYDKESYEFEPRDEKLLSFLVREGHTSPFRHAALTFEVYAPLFVARQWWKYAVSSTHVDDQNGWNESSRRYITEEEQFYVPLHDEWRSKPENSKQGSGEPVSESLGMVYTNKLSILLHKVLNGITRLWMMALLQNLHVYSCQHTECMYAGVGPHLCRV